MAHQILGQRFKERRSEEGPAWHRLGEVYARDRLLTASEAVDEVTGGIVVSARPVCYLDLDGAPVPLDGQQAIIRSPTDDDPESRLLGMTTSRWHHVSFSELARALDGLTKSGGDWRVETCGVIEQGGLCFLALRGKDFAIKGDEMQDYFIVNLSQIPKKAHWILSSPVKVVCANTNLVAHGQATIALSIPHTADATSRLKMCGDLVARFKESSEATREAFTAMAESPISADGLQTIIDAAYPQPTKPAELRMLESVFSSAEQGAVQDALGADNFSRIVKAQETWDRQRETVQSLHEATRERFEAFDPAKLRGTVWAAYNAVTEVADWRQGRGEVDRATVWGGRAQEKVRAYSAAVDLVMN